MSAFRFAPALVHPKMTIIHQGKTRDTFAIHQDVGNSYVPGEICIVATDRLSTHNVVHESAVPGKGEVLTALSIFWLTQVLEQAGIHHHMLAYGKGVYDHLPWSRKTYPPDFHYRAIVVRQLDMIPVEFIWRGYLCGSLYKNFYAKGLANPYGFYLPPGLPLMKPFSSMTFTPTDKSETDDPLDSSKTVLSYPAASRMTRDVAILVRDYLRRRGLELVDTKFEVGLSPFGPCLGDEVATPDSSRICKLSDIDIGVEPPWLDKQVARNEAERVWAGGPKVPLEFGRLVTHRLAMTYLDVFERVTGSGLEAFKREYLD